jgi:hypothetical protein
VLTSPRVAECKLGAPSFAFDQLPGIDVLPLAAHPTHLSNTGEGIGNEQRRRTNWAGNKEVDMGIRKERNIELCRNIRTRECSGVKR